MPGLVQATWDDAPHLTQEQKDSLWAEIPEHEKEARAKGIPMLGAGCIYPYPESTVFCEAFEPPAHWPKAYGFDADWNNTAALWGAWDRDSDVVYVYSEHFMQQQPPAIHAQAINARGDWIIGAMDPSTHGKINATDGTRLVDEYRALGLNLVNADNSVEAGIFAVQKRLSSGGLKIFDTCRYTKVEYRIYRRDPVRDAAKRVVTSKVVKVKDHLMDALRYLIMTGMMHSSLEPNAIEEYEHEMAQYGRDDVTGY